jgi:hypothetical protein
MDLGFLEVEQEMVINKQDQMNSNNIRSNCRLHKQPQLLL